MNFSSMDCSIKRQKVEAMKKYKRAKFVYNLVLYSLTSLITCLFFTYPFWFPSMNQLFSYDVLDNISFLFNAKSSFIVGNLIVLVLVWELVAKGPSCSSPASDMYDEYVSRSRVNYIHKANLSKQTNGHVPIPDVQEKNHGIKGDDKICREERHKTNKKKKKETRACESIVYHNEERKKGMRSSKSESDMAKREKTFKEEEEEGVKECLPREELNKRVEAFIARVNKQRSLEDACIN